MECVRSDGDLLMVDAEQEATISSSDEGVVSDGRYSRTSDRYSVGECAVGLTAGGYRNIVVGNQFQSLTLRVVKSVCHQLFRNHMKTI